MNEYITFPITYSCKKPNLIAANTSHNVQPDVLPACLTARHCVCCHNNPNGHCYIPNLCQGVTVPNDAEIGLRHQLEVISIFDDNAHLTEAGGPYQGLSREKARKIMLSDLKDQGLLEGELGVVFSLCYWDMIIVSSACSAS